MTPPAPEVRAGVAGGAMRSALINQRNGRRESLCDPLTLRGWLSLPVCVSDVKTRVREGGREEMRGYESVRENGGVALIASRGGERSRRARKCKRMQDRQECCWRTDIPSAAVGTAALQSGPVATGAEAGAHIRHNRKIQIFSMDRCLGSDRISVQAPNKCSWHPGQDGDWLAVELGACGWSRVLQVEIGRPTFFSPPAARPRVGMFLTSLRDTPSQRRQRLASRRQSRVSRLVVSPEVLGATDAGRFPGTKVSIVAPLRAPRSRKAGPSWPSLVLPRPLLLNPKPSTALPSLRRLPARAQPPTSPSNVMAVIRPSRGLFSRSSASSARARS